jgi:hypothetical protein
VLVGAKYRLEKHTIQKILGFQTDTPLQVKKQAGYETVGAYGEKNGVRQHCQIHALFILPHPNAASILPPPLHSSHPFTFLRFYSFFMLKFSLFRVVNQSRNSKIANEHFIITQIAF